MAQHKVQFNVPSRPLSYADIIFTVEKDEEKFGELRISQGALVWFPRNKQIGYRLSWKKLDAFFQEHGRRRPTRG
jgi:hypothetical protein